MIKSLYGKFLLYTIGIMFISSMLAFLAVNTYYHQQLKEQNDTKNMNIVKEIVHFIESNETLHLEEYLTTQANVGYKLVLVDENGERNFFGEPFRENNLTNDAISQVLNGNVYHGMRDFPKETFMTGFFADETENTVGSPLTYNGNTYELFLHPNIKLLFTEFHYLLGGMFICMAIISLVSMLFVARKLIQPITELTKATKKIGAEQFSISLPTGRGDEIGELANSFQKMADHLRESDQMKKQFINDVSHDFQTPLQNIKGYANLLHEGNITDDEKRSYTEIIQSETERLSAMTKQLLLLTSLDSITEQIKMTSFHVDDQIKEVIHRYRWLMEEKNISLTAEIHTVSMYGNKEYFEKVWENLLSNALKYTPSKGKISISLIEENEYVVITFNDSG